MSPSRITKSYNNNKANAVETISGARAGLSETSFLKHNYAREKYEITQMVNNT